MATDLRLRRRARTVLATGLLLALLGVAAAPTLATASEEAQGAQLLQSFQAGKKTCQQLSRDQFELIGESVMGRMLGSTATHEAMNRQMTSVMGTSGEAQAHTFMGQRFTGCAAGRAPAAFGSMMGMMGGYASASGSMMGGSSSGSSGDSGWSGADTVIVVLMGILLAAVLGVLVAWRPWRRPSVKAPLDLLNERYARGEIDSEEYASRRQALGGLT
jgi:putative membrane protein